MKTFVPPGMETISDLLIARCITKLQVHLNHSADVIIGAQASISLLNSKIGYMPEDHTKIWCAMGYIVKNLVSHGSVLDNPNLDLIIKDNREANILTVNIKTSVSEAMAQATLEAAKFGSISATLTQLVTPGAGGCLNYMHHALKMGYNNIGVLQQTLTELFNVVGTLEQKMHYMSQNGTYQSIK